MALEFAFASKCNDPQVWVWFPGWGFKAEVFTELAQYLPGQHYWYRWFDHENFTHAVAEVCQTLPHHAILVGWSLGGALAEAVAHCQPAPAALITLATPPKFCRGPQWPYGMSQARFNGFVSSFADSQKKTQVRFLGLCAQGTAAPKDIIRFLAHQQLEPSVAMGKQLQWLDQYDFTAMPKATCLCLHLFAEHDALVSPPHSHGQGHSELITGVCHALFIQSPEVVQQYLLAAYTQLSLKSAQRAKLQVASQFSRAAHSYDQAARIQHFSGLELAKQIEQLHICAHQNMQGHWLDLGCGTGFAVPSLLQQGAIRITGADLAHGMCLASNEKLSQLPFHAVTCDAENLPFVEASFDGIYSNLMVQWSEQIDDLFYETQRVLKPGGLFAFATLGPRTMYELKAAWQQVDPFVHVNRFSSRKQVVEQCEVFFDIESIQQQEVVQQHENLSSLLKELKAIGATNVNSGRRPGLGGRERLRQLDKSYRRACASEQSLPVAYLPLTYDLIWIIARKR
jgi:malonyl-ACP O-methyltransferase BioC